MTRKPRRQSERLIEFVVGEVFVFIKQTFPFPRLVNSATAGLKGGEKLSGEALSPGFRSWFLEILQKVSPTCQDESTRRRGFREKRLDFHSHGQRKSKVNYNAHRRVRSHRHNTMTRLNSVTKNVQEWEKNGGALKTRCTALPDTRESCPSRNAARRRQARVGPVERL